MNAIAWPHAVRREPVGPRTLKSSKLVIRVTAFGIVLFWCLSCPLSHASGYRVTGEMTYWKSAPTNTAKHDTWTFEVRVLGNRWLEAVHGTNDQDDLLGSDGESVYWIFQDEPAKKRGNLTSFVGSVFDGSYPIQSAGVFTVLPWIAYCSGNTMRGVTNGEITLPAPWLMAFHDPEAHFYRARYTELPGGMGLPSRLDYQLDQELMAAFRKRSFGGPVPPSENRRQ